MAGIRVLQYLGVGFLMGVSKVDKEFFDTMYVLTQGINETQERILEDYLGHSNDALSELAFAAILSFCKVTEKKAYRISNWDLDELRGYKVEHWYKDTCIAFETYKDGFWFTGWMHPLIIMRLKKYIGYETNRNT